MTCVCLCVWDRLAVSSRVESERRLVLPHQHIQLVQLGRRLGLLRGGCIVYTEYTDVDVGTPPVYLHGHATQPFALPTATCTASLANWHRMVGGDKVQDSPYSFKIIMCSLRFLPSFRYLQVYFYQSPFNVSLSF